MIFPVSAALAALKTARSPESQVRRFWGLVAAGMSLMMLGEGWRALSQISVDSAGPSGPNPSDIFFLPAYLLLLAAMVLLLWNRFGLLTVLGRMKQTLDGLILATLAVVLVTMVLSDRGPGQPSVGIYGLYAMLDLVILICLLLAIMTPGAPTGCRRWETLVALGMALFAAADLAFNQVPAFGGFSVEGIGGAILDVVWILGYAAIAAGAIKFRDCRQRSATLSARTKGGGMEATPLLVAVVAIPLFMWRARDVAAVDASYWVWVIAATWLGMLIVARVAVIAADNRELASRSITDPLTGVANHRFFQERLGIEIERARRTDDPVTLAVFDLDDLRTVNNTRGHLAGDRKIRLIAAAIAETVRASDLVSRVEGDEFAVILPGTRILDAYAVIDRIMDEIAARQSGQMVRTTVSAGLASFPEHAADTEAIMARAVEALHAAKDGGRNRAVIYEPGSAGLTTEQRIRAVEQESLLRTVRALAAAVDARDSYTHSHSRSVSKLVVALARRLGLVPGHIDKLKIAALLHDVGKIGTPDDILRKPAELNDEEYKIVMGHPELGERILANVVTPEMLPWVASHHERWDGSGYPRGIAGEKIPLEARIIAICDTFDAMTSDRPYRRALPVDHAIEEIRLFSGRQFDPRIASAFVGMMGEVKDS